MNLDNIIPKLTEKIKVWANKKFVESSNKSIDLKRILVNDANLIIEPGFYFISSAHILENCPVRQGLLLVFNEAELSLESYPLRHYQIIFEFNTNNVYHRTVFAKDQYQDWKLINEVDTSVIFSSKVLSETNLDNVVEPGNYNVSGNAGNTGLPSDEDAGLLLVYNDTGFQTRLYQIFIGYRTNNFYIRNRLENFEFTEWKNLVTDIDKITNRLESSISFKSDSLETMKKNEFLQYESGNLFDGKFYEGYRITNWAHPDMQLVLDDDFKYLAIISIKPNTRYTINIENQSTELAEDGDYQNLYYLKVVTTTKLLNYDDYFDGSFVYIKSTDVTNELVFESGENDHFCYIQVAKNPETVPYLQIVEGEQKVYTKLGYGNDKYSMSDKILLGETQLAQANNNFVKPINLLEEIDYLPYDTSTGNSINGSFEFKCDANYQSTLLVPIKPNTTYTLFRSYCQEEFPNNTQTSGSKYYYARYATASKKLARNEKFTSVKKALDKYVMREEITTGPDDHYLYLQLGRWERPDAQLVEGVHDELVNGCYYGLYRLERKNSRPLVLYSERAINSYINKNALAKYNNLLVSKTARYLTIQRGRTTYRLRIVTDTPTNINTWRIVGMEIDGKQIFNMADIEGVLLEKGASDHIGGYHGDEKYNSIEIFIDGKSVKETDSFSDLLCNHIVIIVNSTVYSNITTNKALFNRIKKLEWKDNKFSVYNTWKAFSNLTLASAKLSGMFSIAVNRINGYSCNVITPVDGYDEYTMPFENYRSLNNHSNILFNKDFNSIVFYGRDGYTITMNSFDSDAENYGGRLIGYDFNPAVSLDVGGIKAYFESYKDDGTEYSIKTGDVLTGHFEIIVDGEAGCC